MRKTLIMLILIILLIPLKASAEFLKVQVTAYCSCPICTGKTSSSPTYGVTKSGISVFDNPFVIAAHPQTLPQGSIVFIDGVGFRLTADTGSFMYWKDGNKVVDLYMPSHTEALKWGRQLKTLLVIRWGWDKWTDVEFSIGKFNESAEKLGVIKAASIDEVHVADLVIEEEIPDVVLQFDVQRFLIMLGIVCIIMYIKVRILRWY